MNEPGSPSELRIGHLSTQNGTLDTVLAIGSGGRCTNQVGSKPPGNQLECARSPPAGTHVEIFSVSDDRWYTGCILTHVSASEVNEELSSEDDGSARSDRYVCVEYNHGSRQKVVLWGDESVIRPLTSEIALREPSERGTLNVMEVATVKRLGIPFNLVS